MQNNHTITITKIHEEVRGFKTFTFAEPLPFTYKPGQFITILDHNRQGEVRRSYSIISTPALNEPMSIAVKRIDNGYFSRKLVDHAKPGDQFITTGAAGFFCLPDNISSYTTIFFFAAGSGIAPILSLIKTVLKLHAHISVFLIYSNRSQQETAFYHDLSQLQSRYASRFQIDFLYSLSADLRKARLNRELLLEFLKILSYERSKTLFYTCGPEVYMRMITFLLVEEGFLKENIKKEDFNPGNKKIHYLLPPDKTTRNIQIDFNGEHSSFEVQYPDSILRSAQKRGISLPYSCETGKCGSCAALCLSGKVWMANNEVLTEKELSAGLVLTCTGHPLDSDIKLRIG